MARIVTVRSAHAAAEEADIAELAALSPQQRLDRALDMIARHHRARDDADVGMERVIRIVPFQRAP